jgi:type I restriction enzyme M protein
MRHFATESGKSKGQFYTPAEVSRIIAKIIGIGGAGTSADTTVYDPTCGSGSLLLKVGDEAHGRSRSTARRRTPPPAAWRA